MSVTSNVWLMKTITSGISLMKTVTSLNYRL